MKEKKYPQKRRAEKEDQMLKNEKNKFFKRRKFKDNMKLRLSWTVY